MHSVDWDGPPPSAPRVPVQVFTVPTKGQFTLRLLGDPEGVWLHWRSDLGPRGRSMPHLRTACPWCPDPLMKWYGYAPALLWAPDRDTGKSVWKPVCLELPLQAVEALAGQQLAGLVVQLTRQADPYQPARPKAPLLVAVIENPTQQGKRFGPPPPPFEIRPILERLWGLSARYTRNAAPPAEDGAAAAPPDLLPFPKPASDEAPPAAPRKRRKQR